MPTLDAGFVPLNRLMAEGRAPGQIVGWRAKAAVSWAQWADEAQRWQRAFAAAAGQRWALVLNDGLSFAAALMGAWQAGKTVVLPADTLPATLNFLRPQVDGFAGDVPVAGALQPAFEAAPASPWQALRDDFAALVVFTSGSSGEPCAAPKKLSQLACEVATLQQCFGHDVSGLKAHGTVSHQHIYGLLFRVLWPLCAGMALVAERLVFPEDLVAALAKSPCLLVASPAHLKRLPGHLPWAEAVPQLRAIFSSGGPLPLEGLHDCRQWLGRAPIEVYGSSETGGIAWRCREQDDAAPWQALPGVDLQLVDERLAVRSPHLPSADWFITADRVALFPAGAGPARFELLARADRIAKIEEKRVSLTLLEQTLLATPWLSAARVVVLPGVRTLLGVVAVPNEAGWAQVEALGRTAFLQALRQTLASCVEASVLPRRWRLTWGLPVNAQSKTTEAALLAFFDPRRPDARLHQRSSTQAELAIEVSPKLPQFEGHFTGAPILAGVVQLDWALQFGRELFELPADFKRVEVLKFQQVIQPGDALKLSLVWDAAKGALSFRYESPRGPHSSGRVMLGGTA